MNRGGALEQAAFLVGRLSVDAAVVAILVGILVTLFGRWLPPRVRYALWLLVPLRLSLPLSFPFRWSIFRAAPRLDSGTTPETTVELVPSHFSVLPEELRVTALPASQLDLIFRVAIIVWIFGMIVFATWLFLHYLALRKRVRSGMEVEDSGAQTMLNAAKERTKITRNCRMIALEGLNSPALFGGSSILVPVGGSADSQLNYGLTHELVHLERKDHWINFLLTFLQVVYWFNPFAWWAFRRLRTEIEICCDEETLELLGRNHRHDYCHALVRLAAAEPSPSSLLGFSFSTGKSELRRRIQSIANPGSTRYQLIVGYVLVVLFAIPVLCDPPRPNVPRMRVEGRVLDDVTGEPVPGVSLLTMHSMPKRSGSVLEIMLAHSQRGRRPGTFRFTIEQPDAYTSSALHLEAPGYEPFDSILFRGRFPEHVTVRMHRSP